MLDKDIDPPCEEEDCESDSCPCCTGDDDDFSNEIEYW
jgi:hypothetical protein